MNKNEFIKYLEIYGSDLSRWPEEAQLYTRAAIQKHPELLTLIKQEEDFERVLNMREIVHHTPDFQNRIILSAVKNTPVIREKRKSLWSYFNEIFISLNIPKPAISLGIVLIIGITIGYLVDNEQLTKLRDEPDIGVMALYEGEIYDFEY